jgi:hypothetical protein
MNEGQKPTEPVATSIAPELKYVVGGFAVVVICACGAIALSMKNDITLEVSEGFASFAVIYIVAQAIERLIQPFTGFLVKAKEKTEVRNDLATSANTLRALQIRNMAPTGEASAEEAKEAVSKERELEQIQADRAMMFWAAATGLALLVCGALELGLIESVADVSGAGDWFRCMDVVITGIAVGSGTKPLHDLISFIQNKKQASKPAADTAAG